MSRHGLRVAPCPPPLGTPSWAQSITSHALSRKTRHDDHELVGSFLVAARPESLAREPVHHLSALQTQWLRTPQRGYVDRAIGDPAKTVHWPFASHRAVVVSQQVGMRQQFDLNVECHRASMGRGGVEQVAVMDIGWQAHRHAITRCLGLAAAVARLAFGPQLAAAVAGRARDRRAEPTKPVALHHRALARTCGAFLWLHNLA